MGLFSKRRKSRDENDYVMVPSEKTDDLVEDLVSEVAEAMEDVKLPEHVLKSLQIGLPYLAQRELSDQAILAGQAAARLGYFSRAAEFDAFHAAREADLDMGRALADFLGTKDEEGISAYDAMTEFACGMVLSEPGRPNVEQGGPLWAVPGIGGDLRLSLADRLLEAITQIPNDIAYRDLLAAWKFGLYLRALEEFMIDDNDQH